MRTNRKKQAVFGGIVLLLLLISYNLWSLKSGRCTMSMMLDLGPVALTLIGCNLLAGVTLVAVKIRRKKQRIDHRCRCGEVIKEDDWVCCPACGEKLR